MFTSDDLIAAVRRRIRRSLRPEPPAGEFPPPWAAWFASMRERAGAVTGASADAIVAIFIAREPALPPRALIALNRWQSFNTLWRQQWHPASRDERSTRVIAIVVSLVVHLLLAIFFAYIAYVRLMASLAPDEPAQLGDDVIQIEFIGDGTPDETSEGPPDVRPDETQPEPAGAAEQQVANATPTPPRQPAPPEPAPPQPTPPPVAQPLQVTETPQPDQTFTLPPPRIADLPQARIETPRLQAPTVALRPVEIPQPVTVPELRDVPAPTIAAPDIRQAPVELVQREIPAPIAPVRMRDVPAPTIRAPQLSAPTTQVVERAIPSPSPSPSPPTSRPVETASAPAASAALAPPRTAPEVARPADGGDRPAADAGGGGKRPSPTLGGLPSTKRSDDWGDSGRDRPGGQRGGLFNADGSPRLANGDGKIGGGLPPGTVTEDFAKIDRNGTWLKRPPTDYTPSSFDKFWVPSETLLQEWVRKSIKEVLIPIPGTSKSIKCSVVLLALGGACSITDPNMQDVEAEAREPPDVPFKPELQEDQDSLANPPKTP